MPEAGLLVNAGIFPLPCLEGVPLMVPGVEAIVDIVEVEIMAREQGQGDCVSAAKLTVLCQ